MLIFGEKEISARKKGSLRELRLRVRVWKPELMRLGDPREKNLRLGDKSWGVLGNEERLR